MFVFDNAGREYAISENGESYEIKASGILPDCKYVDIKTDLFAAKCGENGYYVIADVNKRGSRLVRFKSRPDAEKVLKQNLMPIFGVKNSNGCFLVIAEGYKYEMSVVFGVKDGEYYIYPRFCFPGGIPYEDISIRVIRLAEDADYSDMAVKYREYKLMRGDCIPLKERIKSNEVLAYAADAPEIRIRLGWKPAPAKILEQTVENEPKMKVACTFDRVCDFIDALKKRRVDKAQICLVGWNKSGHDGRWPQTFPVEEKLGGEEKLKKLIAYAQKNGYQIVCHTNSTDSYSIADTFSEDIVTKRANGTLVKNTIPWSGGIMYDLCPIKALEYADRDLPEIRKLGFKGLHYIDVMSVVPLRWCFDKNHPLNSRQTLECYNKIMEKCHELFGGFASEGVFDFCAKYLDYGLYVSFPLVFDDLLDEEIPFWEIAYHGIILYNTSTDTVNYCIKDGEMRLKAYETGARPSFYIYSKFKEGSSSDDWLGKEDLACGTEEERDFCADKIAQAYDEFKKYRHLQTEFIVRHRKIGDNVFETEYSNGETVVIDYDRESITTGYKKV